MADDPYATLGVSKTATDDEIRSAYRKLAKQNHPDLNPGKPAAEERFKAISTAYDLLSDPQKRARFDRGEIDASGQERPPERPFYRSYGDQTGRTKYRTEQNFDPEDLEDILSAFGGGGFGRGQGFGGRGFRARGADARYSLTVDFLDAAKGATKRLTLPDGKTLDVNIPPGLKDGQVLRLKGQGMPGIGDGPAGDALIEVQVAPHPFFRREGDNVVVTVPVTMKEAILGAKIDVPTIDGPVFVTVPPYSQNGARLRLRGRGIAGGDQYVELKPLLPPAEEPELAEFLKTWKPRHPQDPRKGMKP
jgi:DnaJ-class molecular chaperone